MLLIDHRGYISVARQMAERFAFRKAAITLRGSISAGDNDWAAMLYENGEAVFSPTYRIHIVDRVGGGDSFGGGLIYSQMVGKSNQDAINFAVAASCLKHTIVLETCRIFYSDPENVKKFEAWKAERDEAKRRKYNLSNQFAVASPLHFLIIPFIAMHTLQTFH